MFDISGISDVNGLFNEFLEVMINKNVEFVLNEFGFYLEVILFN